MFRLRFLTLVLAACLTLSLSASAQTPNLPPGSKFVMSHFKNNGGGGDEKLYISVSPDGLNWTALNNGNPVWQPANWPAHVVRDPTIIFHGGFYWVAHTSGPYGSHESFGLLKSQDLLNWTFVGEINVQLPGATDQLTWSPVFFQDGDGSVHIFINISPTAGTTLNPHGTMRTYETHPISADWTQWSTPSHIPLPGNNSNELFVWKEGATYHGIYVDFPSGSGWIKVTSSNLLSGWGNDLWLGMRAFEGGMVLKKPDGSGYRFFLEPGNAKTPPSGTYRWADLDNTFQYVTDFVEVQSDIGMRNGKMTALDGTTSYSAWKDQTLAGQESSLQAPLADPDSDGLPNLLEAAGGFNPLLPVRTGFPRLSSSGSSFIFHRAPWLQATLTPEGSSDLVTWSSEGLETQSITLLTNGSEEIQVKDVPTGDLNRFLRLRAVIPETLPTTTLSTQRLSLETSLATSPTRKKIWNLRPSLTRSKLKARVRK